MPNPNFETKDINFIPDDEDIDEPNLNEFNNDD